MKEKDTDSDRTLWAAFILLAALVVTVSWVLRDFSEKLNTAFSGLAFAGVIFAILLQRKELSLQRQELAQTREELRRSAEAQEALNESHVRPRLKITYRPAENVGWFLEVVNEGPTPAENVRLVVDKVIYLWGERERKLEELPIFARGGLELSPGIKLKYRIMDHVKLKDGSKYNQPEDFSIVARYSSGLRKYEERFALSTDLIEHVSIDYDRFGESVKDAIKDISKELEKIRKDLERLRGIGR